MRDRKIEREREREREVAAGKIPAQNPGQYPRCTHTSERRVNLYTTPHTTPPYTIPHHIWHHDTQPHDTCMRPRSLTPCRRSRRPWCEYRRHHECRYSARPRESTRATPASTDSGRAPPARTHARTHARADRQTDRQTNGAHMHNGELRNV